MKSHTIFGATLLIGFTAAAFSMVDDVITRLGMSHSHAQNYIVRNLVGNFEYGTISTGTPGGDPNSVYNQLMSFKLPYMPKLSTVISGDKAAAAQEVCEYVKQYVNSQEFMDAYNKNREEAMPLKDNGSGLADLKKNKTVFETNIRNYKNDTKYVAEQQQKLDETQKRIEAMTEMAKKPFPGKDKWEKLYPADPAVVVKKRLQEYLALAATVDFNAALTEADKYKRKKFVNALYEKKSLKWKAIYRAGKEVNDVVTAFAKEWLKGEIIAKEKTSMAEYDAPKQTTSSPAASANSNTNSNSNSKTTPAPTNEVNTPVDKPAEKAKEKKSLFKKLKEKIGQ